MDKTRLSHDRLVKEIEGTGCTVAQPSKWHWQVKYQKKILVNVWPTKLKTLEWWSGARQRAKEWANEEKCLIEIKRQIADFKKHCPQEARKKPTKGLQEARQKTATGLPEARKKTTVEEPSDEDTLFTRGTGYARVEAVLDGKELRLIFNSSGHSESMRLSEDGTKAFIRKVKKLGKQL